MAGILSNPTGVLPLIDLFDLVPDSYKQKDVPLRGEYAPTLPSPDPRYPAKDDPNFLKGRDNNLSGSIEDRRYMTSPNNPFMRGADRLSVERGYYRDPSKEPEKKLVRELTAHFQAGREDPAVVDRLIRDYVTAFPNLPADQTTGYATWFADKLR